MASSRAALHPPRSEEELALVERFDRHPADKARAAAFAAFEKQGLPHRRVEGWRWSDVRAAVRGFDKADLSGDFHGDAFGPTDNSEVHLTHKGGGLPLPRDGVRIEFPDQPTALDSPEQAPMAALAAGLARTPVRVDITASQAEPIRLMLTGSTKDQFHRCIVRVREGVEAHVLESHLAFNGFTSAVIEYQLDAGAKLSRSVFQFGGKGAVLAATALVSLRERARYSQTVLALGAKLARLETRLDHLEAGSEAVLNGAYLAGDGLHADLTSHVRHAAPHCTTRQVTKGVARKGGKGVFQGKFLVERGAQKTDADMQHHALLLDEGAEINAKPELEIYADDVACAHGNSVGALDAAALFYIRQRGVPLEEAQAMLIEGFIAEALEASPRADALMAEARRWLLGQAA